jgi:hypothetical protein
MNHFLGAFEAIKSLGIGKTDTEILSERAKFPKQWVEDKDLGIRLDNPDSRIAVGRGQITQIRIYEVEMA